MNLAFSTAVALVVCLSVDWAFARAFGAASNWESVVISALYRPDHYAGGARRPCRCRVPGSGLGLGDGLEIHGGDQEAPSLQSRRVRRRAVGIGLHRTVSWWVGDDAALLPVIVLGGALMLSRLRYNEMVAGYAVVVLAISIAHGDLSSLAGVARISMMAIHSMFCFFGLVMLTEPRTAPVGQWRQIVYGALVGLLFSPFTHIGSYYFTPEVAILGGNLFTFLANKRRLRRWTEAFA